jgi:hypothetical protein
VPIRNILYGAALVTLLAGCAGQAVAGEAAPVPAVSPPAPFVVPFPTPYPPHSPAASARSGWIEPAAYTFTLTASCGLTGRFRSVVKNGLVVENAGLDDAGRAALNQHLSRLVPTLGQLTAQADGSDPTAVTTDPTDGHPTSIVVGRRECYRISDYSVG